MDLDFVFILEAGSRLEGFSSVEAAVSRLVQLVQSGHTGLTLEICPH